MSNIDKQALRMRNYLNTAVISGVKLLHLTTDELSGLLDELEAEKERSEEFLRQARSFREAHESASEIIRKLERNKPTVKLPTTRLWGGKIACYEESEIVAMLEGAGISIAAGIGKGE